MINPSYELILRAMGDADTLIQWDILIKLQRSLMQGGGNWVLHSALRTIFLFFVLFPPFLLLFSLFKLY